MEKTTTSYEGKGANSFFLFKRNLLTLTQFSEQTQNRLIRIYIILKIVPFRQNILVFRQNCLVNKHIILVFRHTILIIKQNSLVF